MQDSGVCNIKKKCIKDTGTNKGGWEKESVGIILPGSVAERKITLNFSRRCSQAVFTKSFSGQQRRGRKGVAKWRAGHAGNMKGGQWPLSSASGSAGAPLLPATTLLIKRITGRMIPKEPAPFSSYLLPCESERCLLPNWFLPVILIIKSVQFS